jgi:hypothetical protein
MDELTREDIMRQAANLKDFTSDMLLPGIKINTRPADFFPIKQMQLMKFDGQAWHLFGDVLTGDLTVARPFQGIAIARRHHLVLVALDGVPRHLENSSPTTVDLIGLKIAQSGIEDRHGDAAPRRTLYQIPNGVLTLCGPTILHVDQQGWSIGRVRLKKYPTDHADCIRRRGIPLHCHHSRAFFDDVRDKGRSGIGTRDRSGTRSAQGRYGRAAGEAKEFHPHSHDDVVGDVNWDATRLQRQLDRRAARGHAPVEFSNCRYVDPQLTLLDSSV